MLATILELVRWAEAEKLDSVQVVQDYFLEKDSRITRSQAASLIERARLQEANRLVTIWMLRLWVTIA